MTTALNSSDTPPLACAHFVTTHWSVVLGARNKNSPASAQALEKLCRTYWYPLYAHVRRLGHCPADAEDLTQGFFARLLQKNYLEAADRAKGRFRTFLLVALERFLAKEWARAHRQKRGGGHALVPFDTTLAERLYTTQSVRESSPERAYEHRWALTLVEQALLRLRAEYQQAGKQSEFDRLKPYLTAQRGTIPYGAVSAAMGATEGAVRVMVHRLRRRFREVFREEVLHTLSDPNDLDEELRHLLARLSE